jgi:NAD(P)-dependent dehydrogenase (short-subunit alcohol dehydrogenase family)
MLKSRQRAQRQRVILITGASRGIGAACAELLASHGHRVFGTSRQQPPSLLNNEGPGQVEMLRMDVDDETSVDAGIQRLLDRTGRLDVVVNNAGVAILGSVEDSSVEEARSQLETNLLGTWRVCRAALPVMRRQGDGLIVNMGSLGGLTGIPFQAIYSASKFGVEGLTESLRMEVRPFGIRVVVLEPGNIDTGATLGAGRTRVQTDVYTERQERAVRAMIDGEADGPAPEAVAQLLAGVIATAKPRVRYTVGALPERAAVRLKCALPSRMFERLLLQSYRLGSGR